MGKRKREEIDEEDASKMKSSKRSGPQKMVAEEPAEEDSFGGRNTGRVRKKSAKVKEMEEFEIEEKKHYRRGSSSNKTVKETTPSLPATPTPKKVKIKQEPLETSTPIPVVKPGPEKKPAKPKTSVSPGTSPPVKLSPVTPTPVTSPLALLSTVPPIPPMKIKQEPVFQPQDETVADETSKLKIISVTPKKQKGKSESPVISGSLMASLQKTPASGSKKLVKGKTDILPIEELSESTPIIPKTEPVDCSDNQEGSVIKLLLNSPAQATQPVIAGSILSNSPPKLSPPASEMSSGIKKALKQKLNKKGKAKHDQAEGSKSSPKSASKKQTQKIVTQPPLSVSLPPDTPSKALAESSSPESGLKMKLLLGNTSGQPSAQVISPQMTVNSSLSPTSPTLDDVDKSGSEKKKRKLKKLKEKEKMITTTIGGNVPSSVSADGPELKPLLLVKNVSPALNYESSDGAYSEPDFDSTKLVIVDKSGASKKVKKKLGKKLKSSINSGTESTMMSKKPIERVAKAVTAKAKMQKQKKAMDLKAEDVLKKKRATAYTLWCNSNRNRVVEENSGIDFAEISRRLAEMWHMIPPKEKMAWKTKAKRMTVRLKRGISMIKTGKTQSTHLGSKMKNADSGNSSQASGPQNKQAQTHQRTHRTSGSDDLSLSPIKGFGIEPVDVAAHLKLLGESLSIIGMRLQEHKGLMAVQGSFSVLLDSMLCALGPLMCLTTQVPEADGCPEEVHASTLDSIAYVMPGL